jgi:hypothetical protein
MKQIKGIQVLFEMTILRIRGDVSNHNIIHVCIQRGGSRKPLRKE